MVDAAALPIPWQIELQAGENTAIADTQKAGIVGTAGMRPHELLEAALASCMSISARMALTEEGIADAGVRVRVHLDRAESATTFRYELLLPEELEPHRSMLAARLERSPVKATLSKQLAFEPVGRADRETIEAYATGAADYAQDWESQPADEELHALLEKFLLPGTVADIGCGSGRDAAWLAGHGWQVTGYDAVPALLDQARQAHPEVPFETAVLPELAGLPVFDNVYCETVIMHLGRAAALESVRRLGELLRPGGRLYLSWRLDGTDRRDERGRLYTAITADQVLEQLGGFTVLYRRELTSGSSGKRVCRILVQRP